MKDYSILKRLEQVQGRQYWRTLDELADTPEFRDMIAREFPSESPSLIDPVTRRNFLKVMGASLAFGGLTACRSRVDEKIYPYAKNPPEQAVPGKPLFFATAMPLGGYGMPLLVESHMGRPTKVEGNPEHPASLGATDTYSQASVLGLYDPDRSQTVRTGNDIASWSDFSTALGERLAALKGNGGAGLRILTETVTSPTFAFQMTELLKSYPQARWVQYDPANGDGARDGSRIALGGYASTVLRVDQADVIVALDSDFLNCNAGGIRYAKDFSRRRRVYDAGTQMNRLYVAEPMPSSTGSTADNRIPVRASDIEDLARALAGAVGAQGIQAADAGKHQEWVTAVAADLQANKGKSIVIAGEQQPAAVHALVHAMNSALGNIGTTVLVSDPLEAAPASQSQGLAALVAEMNAAKIDTLIILGGNPVFSAPADLKFEDALKRVTFSAHLSLYSDETSALVHWHLPETHYLEAWSDIRTYDGTVSIVQPLIAPLYNGKSAHEVLAIVAGQMTATGYELVQNYWKAQRPGANFDKFWQKALHDGMIEGTASKPRTGAVAVNTSAIQASEKRAGLEIVFRPDPCLYDGRFANNAWLQELPNPFTKVTWDNCAYMSAATAAKLGVTDRDLVELEYAGRKVKAPVMRVPGHADESITVHYGHGRTRAGKVGTGTGFNAYALRTSAAPFFATGLKVNKTGDTYEVAVTQGHFNMENRQLVRSATYEEFKKNPNFAVITHGVTATGAEAHDQPGHGKNGHSGNGHDAHGAAANGHAKDADGTGHNDTSLYPDYKYPGYAWGMSIDTSVCINCNACVVACQAENNIPVVGKTQVLKSREMHWLRIDTYYEGSPEAPKIYNQPIPCMHCENAPCEPVCPVHATTHSSEGLNDMTYNRCVGTRFCANNCPYKVRRFNYLTYQDWTTPILKGLRNPDVTVRERGVMEKCTYCVQRINHARIDSEREGRQIADGEIKTACQASCPTEAIVFGNINDKKSRVSHLKAQAVNYGLLEDLNTKPRTTYLATVRNPNPDAPGANVGAPESDRGSSEARAEVVAPSEMERA